MPALELPRSAPRLEHNSFDGAVASDFLDCNRPARVFSRSDRIHEKEVSRYRFQKRRARGKAAGELAIEGPTQMTWVNRPSPATACANRNFRNCFASGDQSLAVRGVEKLVYPIAAVRSLSQQIDLATS